MLIHDTEIIINLDLVKAADICVSSEAAGHNILWYVSDCILRNVAFSEYHTV